MKKDQIIKSARELFTQYGYRRVSMDEIAQKANVTKKTIYSYFKDKDELFNYFVTEHITKMKEIMDKTEKKEGSFLEKVHETIYELLKYKNKEPFLVNLSKEADSIRSFEVKKKLKTLDDAIQEYIQQKLVDAIENKYVRPCDVNIASFLIYKMYVALMYEWKDSKESLNEKEVSDNITKLLKDGLLYQHE